MIEDYSFDEFESTSKSEWRTKLNKDLGEDVADRISAWKCERDLSLLAYYDSEDLKQHINSPHRSESSWKYIQPINSNTTNKQILKALMNGADGIVLSEGQFNNLNKLLEKVEAEHCTLAIRTFSASSYQKFITWWTSNNKSNKGDVLIFRPDSSIESLVESSTILETVDVFKKGVNLGHRTLNIDCGILQRRGGSSLLELAYMLSQSVYYINKLVESGFEIEAISRGMFISTSIGSSYFLEMAKVRAMRLLISQILNTYGVKRPDVKIHADASPLSKSSLDQNTNFLRSTTEAMSAVLGGVDYLSINSAHDLKSADRIDRNISNLLKEESHLATVNDPASGSYYLEDLTQELMKKAWLTFQEIEKNGGFEVAIKKGLFQSEAKEDLDFQEARILKGRRKLVGINDFGNQEEQIDLDRLNHSYFSLSHDFENVRLHVELYVQKYGDQARPAAKVLTLGSNAKMITARTTFISNFFSWAGIKVEKVTGDMSFQSNDIVVCCGADEDYSDLELEKVLNESNPTILILAAGKKSPEASSKISSWINVKTNRLEGVKNVLTQMGVYQNQNDNE